MDVINHLQNEYHRQGIVLLAKKACADPHIFNALFHVYMQGDEALKPRAAWALGHAAEIRPLAFKKAHAGIIKQLQSHGLHQSIYRCAFKCLEEIDIAEKHIAIIFNLACKYLTSEIYETAVRAFAITVAAKCALPYPELRNELILMLRVIKQQSVSAAINVRVRKALKVLAV